MDDSKSRYELEELVVQPGTYFNPQTEVVVIVDDSASIDQEIFNMESYEGADWVRIADDVAVDEQQRDELLEHFQWLTAAESASLSPQKLAAVREEIADVLLYGMARPSQQPGAERLSSLPAAWLEAYAERIRNVGLPVVVRA